MNVAMATASSSVQMFLAPIPVRATLALPSMKTEGLAKVGDVQDRLNRLPNPECKMPPLSCAPVAYHLLAIPTVYRKLTPELGSITSSAVRTVGIRPITWPGSLALQGLNSAGTSSYRYSPFWAGGGLVTKTPKDAQQVPEDNKGMLCFHTTIIDKQEKQESVPVAASASSALSWKASGAQEVNEGLHPRN